MTGSFTITESQTFTITHARHMAAKVATDLRRLRSFYGKPSDKEIEPPRLHRRPFGLSHAAICCSPSMA